MSASDVGVTAAPELYGVWEVMASPTGVLITILAVVSAVLPGEDKNIKKGQIEN